MKIYPNPSNGTVYLHIDVINTQRYELNVHNLLGEEIYTEEINAGTHALNLSNQPEGVYFVTLKNQKEIITQKITIIK